MRKLAIVGGESKTRHLAPYDDQSFDIWTFNEAPQNDWCKRWTACFQLHKPEVYQSLENVNNRGHWDWLQKDHGKRTIWMQDYDEFVPNSRRYPMDEIVATFPAAQPLPGSTFLTSSVVMALALALYQGYEYIEIYGVSLESNTEYASQQSCWLYWVGVAKAILGENLILKSGEHLYQARVYGYEGEVQLERDFYKSRIDYWTETKRAADPVTKKLKERALDALTDFEPTKFADLLVQAQNRAKECGMIDGSIDTAKRYYDRQDPISAQQFEREGAQAQADYTEVLTEADKKAGAVEYLWNAWRTTNHLGTRDQIRAFARLSWDLYYKAGYNEGVATENKLLMNAYNERARAAGGVRTLRSMGMM